VARVLNSHEYKQLKKTRAMKKLALLAAAVIFTASVFASPIAGVKKSAKPATQEKAAKPAKEKKAKKEHKAKASKPKTEKK